MGMPGSTVHRYRRFNKYNEENFKTELEYDDIEAGMEIELWWPYQENPNQPEGGRFREARVIAMVEQYEADDKDDAEITLNQTLIDASIIEEGKFEGETEENFQAHLLSFCETFQEDEEEESEASQHREKMKLLKKRHKKDILAIDEQIDNTVQKMKAMKHDISMAVAWRAETQLYLDSKRKKTKHDD